MAREGSGDAKRRREKSRRVEGRRGQAAANLEEVVLNVFPQSLICAIANTHETT